MDAAKLESMQAVNAAHLATMEEAIKDAEENMGDIESRDALLAKADYLCKLGARRPRPAPELVRCRWEP